MLGADENFTNIDADIGEVYEFDISNKKIKNDLLLNFTPFSDGLSQTIAWFSDRSR
jgi:hypothetical protein